MHIEKSGWTSFSYWGWHRQKPQLSIFWMAVFDNSDDCHYSPSDDDANDCRDFHGDNGADHNVKQNSVSNADDKVEQSTPLDY